MQDQWFGDEGDFVKFRLLRHLCGITAKDGPRLSLGVVWYKREPKNLAYLEPGGGGEGYEAEDGDLFRSLRGWMRDERSRGVSLMEGSFLFPADTVWFSDAVPASGREKWLLRASAAVNGRRVVFLDPDTGMAPKKGTGKHVLWDELTTFCTAEPEPTVIVYQHSRRRKRNQQIKEQIAQIRNSSGRDCVVAVWRREPDQRLFYVIPSERDRKTILERIGLLKWATEPDTCR